MKQPINQHQESRPAWPSVIHNFATYMKKNICLTWYRKDMELHVLLHSKQNKMVIWIFIDNKTTDGDLVNSRQQGANIF